MLLFGLFIILLVVFVSALFVVYILLKSNHRIISTIIDVQTFQLINIEQFLLLEQISMEYLNEVEYTIYKKFSFKTFLLYLCYCLNEQFEENLNNHLVNN
ncbi:hypothetical protein [Phocaeicola plebeius]|uniref:hypothetical protein n=1 Tax=Phocaeicola plebeius TaxID=310297 RepID=UPI003AF628A2